MYDLPFTIFDYLAQLDKLAWLAKLEELGTTGRAEPYRIASELVN